MLDLAGRDWVVAEQDLRELLAPPPPLDLVKWAVENVRFGQQSALPGPFDPERFPFYNRILSCLSPNHPARVVVLKGSAQIGKTVLGEIFLGGTQVLDPSTFMVCHPTEDNMVRWIIGKWWPLIRGTPALAELYESRGSKEGGSSRNMAEQRRGGGLVIFSGANSAASLSQISVRRQLQDDLSKWHNLPEGDPEGLADDRSKAFVDAKIFKISTPNLEHDCRITEVYNRGTMERYYVPCPHCAFEQTLEWAAFKARIGTDPTAINFVCPNCNGLIEERHRYDIVRRGRWIADRPGAEIVSFSIWAIYCGLEPWKAIAETWLAAKGNPADEKRVDNTSGGEVYALPGDSPPWGELRDRAEAEGRPRGIVPRQALILTMGVDIQDLHCEAVVVGWGRDFRRWVIDHAVVEGHISTEEAQAGLKELIDRQWPSETGIPRQINLTAIDGGAWQSDVYGFVAGFPKSRVVMTRGVAGDDKPPYASVLKERRRDGTLVKYRGRFFNVGVNGLKGGLYKALRIIDPNQRGYISFPAGLEPTFYEQLTSEKRVAQVDRRGFTSWVWVKPASARNECLDCSNYAEAAATMLNWRTKTPAAWDWLEASLNKTAPTELPAQRPLAQPMPRPPEAPGPAPTPPAQPADQQPVIAPWPPSTPWRFA